jgi:lactam utilization protein B
MIFCAQVPGESIIVSDGWVSFVAGGRIVPGVAPTGSLLVELVTDLADAMDQVGDPYHRTLQTALLVHSDNCSLMLHVDQTRCTVANAILIATVLHERVALHVDCRDLVNFGRRLREHIERRELAA